MGRDCFLLACVAPGGRYFAVPRVEYVRDPNLCGRRWKKSRKDEGRNKIKRKHKEGDGDPTKETRNALRRCIRRGYIASICREVATRNLHTARARAGLFAVLDNKQFLRTILRREATVWPRSTMVFPTAVVKKLLLLPSRKDSCSEMASKLIGWPLGIFSY